MKFCAYSLIAGFNSIFGSVDVGILKCFRQKLQSQGRLFIINSKRVVMVTKLAMATEFSSVFVLSVILIYPLNSKRSIFLYSLCCHVWSRSLNFPRQQPQFNSYLPMRSGEKSAQFISGVELTLTVSRSSGLGRRKEIRRGSCTPQEVSVKSFVPLTVTGSCSTWEAARRVGSIRVMRPS